LLDESARWSVVRAGPASISSARRHDRVTSAWRRLTSNVLDESDLGAGRFSKLDERHQFSSCGASDEDRVNLKARGAPPPRAEDGAFERRLPRAAGGACARRHALKTFPRRAGPTPLALAAGVHSSVDSCAAAASASWPHARRRTRARRLPSLSAPDPLVDPRQCLNGRASACRG